MRGQGSVSHRGVRPRQHVPASASLLFAAPVSHTTLNGKARLSIKRFWKAGNSLGLKSSARPLIISEFKHIPTYDTDTHKSESKSCVHDALKRYPCGNKSPHNPSRMLSSTVLNDMCACVRQLLLGSPTGAQRFSWAWVIHWEAVPRNAQSWAFEQMSQGHGHRELDHFNNQI